LATITAMQLTATMVHELPRGRSKEGEPSDIVYSAAPTPLAPATDRFIRESMVLPALESSRAIVENAEYASKVPKLVREILSDHSKLAPNSRAIADRLSETQTGGASAGVFLASLANADGIKRVVVMKAEHQEGVRLSHTGSGDNVVFEVQHLTELIMGDNSKVYKIGVLWLDEEDQLVGLMVDRQNGRSFAEYFLTEFLGCDLRLPAEKLTKEFVDTIEKFINLTSLTPEKRARYSTAAVAVLQSPAKQLSPIGFAMEFIEAEDRDTFREMLPTLISHGSFTKDTTLVHSQIGGLKVKTDTGVVITASEQALADGTVLIESDAAGGPRVVVNGNASKFNLARQPR
jgi:hypothetical protein